MIQKAHPGIAQKPATEPLGGMIVQLSWRGLLENAAVFEQNNLIRQRHGLVLIVGDVDNRLLQPVRKLLQILLKLKFSSGIDIGNWFIEKDDAGLPSYRSRKSYPLPGTVIKIVGVLFQTLLQAKQSHGFPHPGLPFHRRKF